MLHAPGIRVSGGTLLTAFLVSVVPSSSLAQEAVVRETENLRAEPNGVVVAVLEPGTPLQVVREQGNWLEIVVEGWVWLASLGARDGAYDLVVTADGGENLRVAPQGSIVARLEEGTLLQEMERITGWVRVRRQAWIWSPSVERRQTVAGESAAASGTTASPTVTTGVFRSRSPAAILTAPDGDTLTTTPAGTELAVTGRQGNWARVRVEGWVWMPPGEAAPVDPSEAEGSLAVDLAAVVADPERYRGRIVTWPLQFVSVERAEAIRTDFYEGEPFLLTRPVDDPVTRFVYVALPPDAVVQGEGLTPLEEITVVGRIRTGASALTGSPILDLVELRRSR